ncbi:hypothetical protein BV898_17970 [Hypsibius exemplaris]|uniref:Uncharacterized protein n=1 Tax=Hypsibius exemplaris TaxID=2072580 RepID=A0A9X6NGC5_HYPEX|nr:hypothetical protein BV898_17970 [Hypsibius exemplaris]
MSGIKIKFEATEDAEAQSTGPSGGRKRRIDRSEVMKSPKRATKTASVTTNSADSKDEPQIKQESSSDKINMVLINPSIPALSSSSSPLGTTSPLAIAGTELTITEEGDASPGVAAAESVSDELQIKVEESWVAVPPFISPVGLGHFLIPLPGASEVKSDPFWESPPGLAMVLPGSEINTDVATQSLRHRPEEASSSDAVIPDTVDVKFEAFGALLSGEAQVKSGGDEMSLQPDVEGMGTTGSRAAVEETVPSLGPSAIVEVNSQVSESDDPTTRKKKRKKDINNNGRLPRRVLYQVDGFQFYHDEKVFAMWDRDEKWYPATVCGVRKGKFMVKWAEGGGMSCVAQTDLMSEKAFLNPGEFVFALWEADGRWYSARAAGSHAAFLTVEWCENGNVTEVSGETVIRATDILKPGCLVSVLAPNAAYYDGLVVFDLHPNGMCWLRNVKTKESLLATDETMGNMMIEAVDVKLWRMAQSVDETVAQSVTLSSATEQTGTSTAELNRQGNSHAPSIGLSDSGSDSAMSLLRHVRLERRCDDPSASHRSIQQDPVRSSSFHFLPPAAFTLHGSCQTDVSNVFKLGDVFFYQGERVFATWDDDTPWYFARVTGASEAKMSFCVKWFETVQINLIKPTHLLSAHELIRSGVQIKRLNPDRVSFSETTDTEFMLKTFSMMMIETAEIQRWQKYQPGVKMTLSVTAPEADSNKPSTSGSGLAAGGGADRFSSSATNFKVFAPSTSSPLAGNVPSSSGNVSSGPLLVSQPLSSSDAVIGNSGDLLSAYYFLPKADDTLRGSLMEIRAVKFRVGKFSLHQGEKVFATWDAGAPWYLGRISGSDGRMFRIVWGGTNRVNLVAAVNVVRARIVAQNDDIVVDAFIRQEKAFRPVPNKEKSRWISSLSHFLLRVASEQGRHWCSLFSLAGALQSDPLTTITAPALQQADRNTQSSDAQPSNSLGQCAAQNILSTRRPVNAAEVLNLPEVARAIAKHLPIQSLYSFAQVNRCFRDACEIEKTMTRRQQISCFLLGSIIADMQQRQNVFSSVVTKIYCHPQLVLVFCSPWIMNKPLQCRLRDLLPVSSTEASNRMIFPVFMSSVLSLRLLPVLSGEVDENPFGCRASASNISLLFLPRMTGIWIHRLFTELETVAAFRSRFLGSQWLDQGIESDFLPAVLADLRNLKPKLVILSSKWKAKHSNAFSPDYPVIMLHTEWSDYCLDCLVFEGDIIAHQVVIELTATESVRTETLRYFRRQFTASQVNRQRMLLLYFRNHAAGSAGEQDVTQLRSDFPNVPLFGGVYEDVSGSWFTTSDATDTNRGRFCGDKHAVFVCGLVFGSAVV